MRISRTVVGFGVLCSLVCALNTSAKAQQSCYSAGQSQVTSLQGGVLSPPIPADAQVLDQGNSVVYWHAKNDQCHPAPECPTCNLHGGGSAGGGGGSGGGGGAGGGGTTDLASGDTSITQSDVRIPGVGGGITMSRTWNSVWPATESGVRTGLFGPNWRSSYEERVSAGSDGYIKYSRGDGGFWSFGFTGYDSSGSNPTFVPVAPSNQTATLTQGATIWTLAFQNGETRTFDVTSGFLTSIIDRNGNATQLSYDTASRLVTVADAGGRHLYFSYANPVSYLITGVSSDVGISLTYLYDGLGRLIKVTKPDLTTTSLQYDSNFFISAVLDNAGKVLESHTYNTCGQGLTSSRAGGVEMLTLSYPPSCGLGLP
jgi:YD repeat-containing protein